MSDTFTIVPGQWHHVFSSTDVKKNDEAQTITGTHVPFALSTIPESAQVASPSRVPTATDVVDDFFGAPRLRVTQHCTYQDRCSQPLSDVPPPPYTCAELPVYSAEPKEEPVTLAKYLFKYGFVFPPFWVLGAVIWMCPLAVPADFEPFRSGAERAQLVQVLRDAEIQWAKRCIWALGVLLLLVGIVTSIAFAIWYS